MRTQIATLVTLLMALMLSACAPSPEVIVITATFEPTQLTSLAPASTATQPAPTVVVSAAGGETVSVPNPERYIVQPGDTLTAIALQFAVDVEMLQTLNNLANPDLLEVGQVLSLPTTLLAQGSDFRIIPDSRLVRAPGSDAFDIDGFIDAQPGFIRTASDEVGEITYSARIIIKRVSLEYSVDARLLLALLEYKGGWLSNASPSVYAQTYAMGAPASPFGFDRDGLYRQLTWAADQLNAGYYGWKVRGLRTLNFTDEVRAPFPATLNAGTVGVQYLLSQISSYEVWAAQVNADGFYGTYVRYFGDPFVDALDPLVPLGLTQPSLTLPFAQGEIWYFTGGWHGGWGSGSAWAAVDFAPPDERPDGSLSCYISDSFTTAIADGVIARSENGSVVLDLDGDGDEATGWTILYLHVASLDRIAQGSLVRTGDRIGRLSCEGGFSNGTHLHIARRYNGEWIAAAGDEYPPFVLNEWQVIGLTTLEYQGYLRRGAEERIAEQGRLIVDNRVGW